MGQELSAMASPGGIADGAQKAAALQPSSSRSSTATTVPRSLTIRELREITHDFSKERLLGQGAYGKVYKGVYENGEEIAVKLLHNTNAGMDDVLFHREFQNLMMVHHHNVIQLVGYCFETECHLVQYKGKHVFAQKIYRALCFQYMHLGSLQRHLFDELHGPGWSTRYKIIKGICEGLQYLHKGLENPMFHLNLKPDNILLDENLTPKLADIGLTRLLGEEQTRVTQSSIGTMGYMPREYLFQHIISDKIDIFSLGVIMIKIIAGPAGHTKSVEMPYHEFLDLVHDNWRNRFEATYSSSRQLEPYCDQVSVCTEIAMSCMQTGRHRRPTIGDIIQKLNDSETFIDKSDYDGETNVLWESTNTLSFSSEMTDQESETKSLEGILIDANAMPGSLSYPFIKSITRDFSTEIGRGGFGVVYMGHLKTGRVAVKKLSIFQGFFDAVFMEEINCLVKTKHNNIVRFLGYCWDSHGELVRLNQGYVMAELPQRLLVFEYVPNGNLQSYLKDKSHNKEWVIRYQIIRGICQGLNYLHEQRIVHCDLKPENIMLDACFVPKITDFGVSKCFDEGVSRIQTKNIRGTLGSTAPETIDSGEITFKSDMYGLGIIIIKLLTGRNNYDFENWHTSLDVDGPQVKNCIEIAQRCLSFDQHQRPGIGEVMQKLNEIERS